jgi:hypothetical protein
MIATKENKTNTFIFLIVYMIAKGFPNLLFQKN